MSLLIYNTYCWCLRACQTYSWICCSTCLLFLKKNYTAILTTSLKCLCYILSFGACFSSINKHPAVRLWCMNQLAVLASSYAMIAVHCCLIFHRTSMLSTFANKAATQFMIVVLATVDPYTVSKALQWMTLTLLLWFLFLCKARTMWMSSLPFCCNQWFLSTWHWWWWGSSEGGFC